MGLLPSAPCCSRAASCPSRRRTSRRRTSIRRTPPVCSAQCRVSRRSSSPGNSRRNSPKPTCASSAAAKAAGVQRLVQLSGVGADPNMCCARMLRWYGQAEVTVAAAGLEVTRLRPSMLMQNLFEFAPSIAQQGVISGPVPFDQVDVGRRARRRRRCCSHAARPFAQRTHLHGNGLGIDELSANCGAYDPHPRQAGSLRGHHCERSARLAAGQRPVAGDDRSEARAVGCVRVEPDQRAADAGGQGSDRARAAHGR